MKACAINDPYILQQDEEEEVNLACLYMGFPPWSLLVTQDRSSMPCGVSWALHMVFVKLKILLIANTRFLIHIACRARR